MNDIISTILLRSLQLSNYPTIQLSKIRVSADLHYGDIQSLKSGDMKIVFMSAGALVLIAIATIDPNPTLYQHQHQHQHQHHEDYRCFETEAYLRMQLEHTYGQVLFALTNHVQTQLAMNPNIDLRSVLGRTTDVVMRKALDWVGPEGEGAGSFMTAGIEVLVGVPLQVGVRFMV